MSSTFLAPVYLSQAEGYLTASALTFVLCDILSTLEDEIKFIWRSKWTWAKSMYIASRYLGPSILLVMMHSVHSADPWSEKRRTYIRIASTFASWMAFFFVNVISSMRVYALYNRNVRILILVLVLWVCQLASVTYSAVLLSIDYTRVLASFPDVASSQDACEILLFGFKTFIGLDSAKNTKYSRITSLIVCTVASAIFLILSLVKLRESITDGRGRVRYEVLKELSCVTPLAKIFISDGAFAFLLVLGVDLATTIVSLDNVSLYYAPTYPWLHAIFSHVGSRLILNLRRAGGRGTPTGILKHSAPRPLLVEVHTSTFKECQCQTALDPMHFATQASSLSDDSNSYVLKPLTGV